MPLLLWDASALAKRYAPEIGSDTTDVLFTTVASSQMAITFLGYAETYSILLRKHNHRVISAATFAAAKSALRTEIIASPDFGLLPIDEVATLDGIDLMERHNINASDAAILATYINFAATSITAGTGCLLVSSDRRLLRAAQLEGLSVLNPEMLAAFDVPTFLTSL